MSSIKYVDTDGVKGALLPKGAFGYDDYEAGGDRGRVYVGAGDENLPLAKKSEVDDLETQVASIDTAAIAYAIAL
jgi:hypothetical protein